MIDYFCPTYKPPSRFKFRTDLLMDYSAALANYVQVKIEKEKLFTVALDGWFSRTNEGIYAINIVTKSGEEILYDVITMANNAASSGFLFSELKQVLLGDVVVLKHKVSLHGI